jgi:hypothetical protein
MGSKCGHLKRTENDNYPTSVMIRTESVLPDFFWGGVAVAFFGLAVSSLIHRRMFMDAIYEYHLRHFKDNKQARENLKKNWRHMSEGRVTDALRTTIAIEFVGFMVAAIAALQDSEILTILLEGFKRA